MRVPTDDSDRSFVSKRQTDDDDDDDRRLLLVLERERIIRTRDIVFDRSDRPGCWAPRSTRRRRDSRVAVVERTKRIVVARVILISIETRVAHPGRGVDTR